MEQNIPIARALSGRLKFDAECFSCNCLNRHCVFSTRREDFLHQFNGIRFDQEALCENAKNKMPCSKLTQINFMLQSMITTQNRKRVRHLILALAPVMVALFSACSAGRKVSVAPASSSSAPALPTAAYRVAPGDNLIIKLYYHPELNTEVWVRPDGFISLELVGEISVAHHTPAQLDTILEQVYSKKLVNPEVAVIVKNSVSLKVFVGGEVASPGLVSIDGGLKLLGAVFQAGGFKSSAQLSQIVLLRNDALSGQPKIMTFDVREVLQGKNAQANVELHPCDVIYVPKSGIARANQFVDEFVQGLLPVSTLSGFAWVYALIK